MNKALALFLFLAGVVAFVQAADVAVSVGNAKGENVFEPAMISAAPGDNVSISNLLNFSLFLSLILNINHSLIKIIFNKSNRSFSLGWVNTVSSQKPKLKTAQNQPMLHLCSSVLAVLLIPEKHGQLQYQKKPPAKCGSTVVFQDIVFQAKVVWKLLLHLVMPLVLPLLVLLLVV